MAMAPCDAGQELSTQEDANLRSQEDANVRYQLLKHLQDISRSTDRLHGDVRKLLEGENKIAGQLEKQEEEKGSAVDESMQVRVRCIRSLLDSLLEIDMERVERALRAESEILLREQKYRL